LENPTIKPSYWLRTVQ